MKLSNMIGQIRTFFILIFFIHVYFVKAGQSDKQQGYIITLQDDTIYGYIQNNGYIRNSKMCVFSRNIDSIGKEFMPGDIHSYKFTEGKYYFSKTVDIDSISSKVFLEYLIDGKVDIYYLMETD
jgi:hypothetical protein